MTHLKDLSALATDAKLVAQPIRMNIFDDDTGPVLTVLSFGGGQDSTALFEMYVNDPEFRLKYAPHRLLVVMSDTGNEFPETYAHVSRIQARCRELGIEFVFITSDMGYHSQGWQSLQYAYRKNSTCGSKAYKKSCSDQLKLKPIYRFLESWVSAHYQVPCKNKAGLREFAQRYGKIRVIVGIAAGEESRMAPAEESSDAWYRDSIETCYPLVDLKMDRKACQEYISNAGQYVPPPSNCMMCPFVSLEELEYLRRFHAEELAEWVIFEANKLKKFAHKEKCPVYNKDGEVTGFKNKNFGVWGVKTLPEKIREAELKFADWSNDRVLEYRFSHGHCVSTKY